MNVHELISVFWNEENRKELSIYSYMLMGNRNDALDLLSDLLIEIYENPKMQDAIEPIPYFKTTLRNKAYNIKKRNSRMIPHDPDMLSGTEPKLYDDTEREHEDMIKIRISLLGNVAAFAATGLVYLIQLMVFSGTLPFNIKSLLLPLVLCFFSEVVDLIIKYRKVVSS